VGIEKNNLADFHAKQATLSDTVGDDSIEYIDFKRTVKKFEFNERKKKMEKY
jgi:hypothetical protein